MLLSLKQELSPSSPSIRPLCPTRWTVRAESLRSVIANYQVLQELMEEIIEEYRGITEATSSAKGILSTMEKISLPFWCCGIASFLQHYRQTKQSGSK